MLKPVIVGAVTCVAISLAALKLPIVIAATATATAPPETLPVPAGYREWTYLTSGMDMTYAASSVATPNATTEHNSVFDNVFVNPEAYRTFKETGTWPDQTIFVLENRAGEPNVSINKGGRTQGAAIQGIELHAKLNNQWAFYARRGDGKEHLIARPATCYTCHEAHAAVDTTFVQFYPTLLPLAEQKGKLSPNYKAAMAAVGK